MLTRTKVRPGDTHQVDRLQAAITMTLTNRETSDREVNCLFPLAGVAANARITLAGVRLQGQARERWEARRHYEQALARGGLAVLVERERTHQIRVRVSSLKGGERIECSLEVSAGSKPLARSGDVLSPSVAYVAVEMPHRLDCGPQSPGKQLALRVAQVVSDTFDMDHDRRRSLAEKVARGLFRDQGIDVPGDSLDQLLDEVLGRPRSSEEPRPAPGGCSTLSEACQLLAEAKPVTPEALSTILKLLEHRCARAGEVPKVARLLYEGERLLRIACQGRQPTRPRLQRWIEGLVNYGRTI